MHGHTDSVDRTNKLSGPFLIRPLTGPQKNEGLEPSEETSIQLLESW